MNDFLVLAHERYSCRTYSDRPVERWKIDRIIEAGIAAPTACNAQAWYVWVVDDPAVCVALQEAFARVESLYIADGHHRCASAVRVGQKRRKAKPDFDGTEEFNFFLAVVFPKDELAIMDYNRVLRDLNGLTTEAFFEKLRQSFNVAPAPTAPYRITSIRG